jgi:hypothetical protein
MKKFILLIIFFAPFFAMAQLERSIAFVSKLDTQVNNGYGDEKNENLLLHPIFTITPSIMAPNIDATKLKNIGTNFTKLNLENAGKQLVLKTNFDGKIKIKFTITNSQGVVNSTENFRTLEGPRTQIINTLALLAGEYYVIADVQSISTNAAIHYYFKLNKQ